MNEWVKTSKIQHPEDVRDALGFSGEPAGLDLKDLYERALKSGTEYSRGDLRIAWKIASDAYYWSAFKRFGTLQTIVNAGFFDDALEPGELAPFMNPQYLTTPLEKIRARVAALEEAGQIHDKPLVVAVTTGCFAPVHDGHVAMMEKAKEALEAKGYRVLGGFMSPSHDNYVATKGETARRLTAAHRSAILGKVLAESDWLAVDPWESRYSHSNINFTDTIEHLRNYVQTHIKTPVPIEIAYVFGADNVQFARAFVEKGIGVCVARPGEDARLNPVVEKSGLRNHPCIVFAESTDIDISSTRVRAGEMAASSLLAADTNFNDLLKGSPRKNGDAESHHTYLVRDDLAWATKGWAGKVDFDVLQQAIKEFRDGLRRAIENAFERSNAPGYPKHVEVVMLSVEDQMAEADKIMNLTPEWVINNDVITGGEHMSIGLSRLFPLSDSQLFSKQLVPRPGREDLKRIMGRLAKGKYKIVDDDIATGSTIRMIENQLPQDVVFEEKIALSELAFKNVYPDRPYAFWDIVDARDFLMGARAGGLVTQLFNGEVGRAPYMLPYVSLVNRAKIPPDQEVAFTQDVLNLNRRFFSDVWRDLTVGDTDPQFQNLMRSIGFRGNQHMTDVCAWHRKHAPV